MKDFVGMCKEAAFAGLDDLARVMHTRLGQTIAGPAWRHSPDLHKIMARQSIYAGKKGHGLIPKDIKMQKMMGRTARMPGNDISLTESTVLAKNRIAPEFAQSPDYPFYTSITADLARKFGG